VNWSSNLTIVGEKGGERREAERRGREVKRPRGGVHKKVSVKYKFIKEIKGEG